MKPLRTDVMVVGAGPGGSAAAYHLASRGGDVLLVDEAADGASSRFASKAGVVRDHSRPVAIAARRYYRISRPQEPVLEAFLDLRDPGSPDGLMAGYGWIFPLGDGVVNVGAGLLNTF